MARGLNLKVNTSALLEFAKRAEMATKITNPVLAIGVNTIGDGVVALVATQLVQKTGLTLEQVRGLIRVKRASRSNLHYEVAVDQRLMTEDADTLAGQREIREFGKRQPGEMVIIVSAKDELVCMDCEELAASGPMPVEIAAAHLPVHPNCRCIMMPYVEKGRRLQVRMTTITGRDPARRAGRKRISLDTDVTLRQLAQNVINNAAGKMRIGLRR